MKRPAPVRTAIVPCAAEFRPEAIEPPLRSWSSGSLPFGVRRMRLGRYLQSHDAADDAQQEEYTQQIARLAQKKHPHKYRT